MTLIANVDYRFIRARPPIGLPKVASGPLTTGLSFLFGSDIYWSDCITGKPGTQGSGTLVRITGPSTSSFTTANGNSGLQTHFISSSWLDYGTHSPTIDVAVSPTGVTWAFYFRLASSHLDSGLMRRNDSNAAGGAGWAVGFAANQFTPTLILERVTTNTNVHGPAYAADGAYHTLVITSPGDRVGASVKFHQDGILQPTTVVNAGSGSSGSDSAQSLELGRNTFTINGSFIGDIQVAAIARRVWGGLDVAKFHRNPFRLFANENVQIRVKGRASLPQNKQSSMWVST